jgi:hypothetical protein
MSQRRFGITASWGSSKIGNHPTGSTGSVSGMASGPAARAAKKSIRPPSNASRTRSVQSPSAVACPVSSENSRTMAWAGVSPASTLPPTPLSRPACHAGLALRTSATSRPESSAMKPHT